MYIYFVHLFVFVDIFFYFTMDILQCTCINYGDDDDDDDDNDDDGKQQQY